MKCWRQFLTKKKSSQRSASHSMPFCLRSSQQMREINTQKPIIATQKSCGINPLEVSIPSGVMRSFAVIEFERIESSMASIPQSQKETDNKSGFTAVVIFRHSSDDTVSGRLAQAGELSELIPGSETISHWIWTTSPVAPHRQPVKPRATINQCK